MTPALRRSLPLLAACALLSLGIGPCGPIPGGSLGSDEITEPVSDWSFANDLRRCAVEVGGPESPRSVTVNCMSHEQRLYVSCSSCEGKRWSAIALEQPAGRVRAGDGLYPVTLRRVEQPEELDAVWEARGRKLGNDPEPRPEEWWSFELSSR
ncbi:MAG: hypothetical protein QNK05_06270 [Myxococcota bacterium]|nr:hypothetical protein [Myxococcota bacterium]